VPWELQGQTSAQVKVTIDEMFGYPLFGNVVTVPLAAYAPSFFVENGTVAAEDALTGAQILASNRPALERFCRSMPMAWVR